MEFIGSLLLDSGLTPPDLNIIGKVVQWMYGWLGNYGLTVIVFALFLKILTFPLDFWQRLASKKSSLKMIALQPQLKDIDSQFEGDARRINEEKQKLYKKNGYNAFSSCLPMLVTMAIFFVMFGGINSYSAFTAARDYNLLYDKYTSTYDLQIELGLTPEQALEDAKLAVGQYYVEEVREDFLWVNNIWRPDTWKSIMVEYDEFIKTNSSGVVNRNIYNNIREGVLESDVGYFGKVENGEVVREGWNGLLIMPILAAGIMFLSTWIMQKQQNAKGGVDMTGQTQQSTKMMSFLMPLMMGVFGFMYTAAFALYMVSNSSISTLVNLATNRPIENLAIKQISKVENDKKPSYKR
ncbi:MAG: YidC/Oxa1 family membrane protein insertase [Clostridia bacterium]|nr:YidC/Oxa1 family membrane protein insertase [Clostridia bacterium]